jgi:hypothetical protein
MSIRGKYKTEGGHKRGHSNMTHWDYTEQIKKVAKKIRRARSKEVIHEQLDHTE